MTKLLPATARGLKPHYKVRLSLQGALIHTASWDEPVITKDQEHSRLLWHVTANWVQDSEYGDVIGFIHWSNVNAVTWRYTD